MLQLFLILQQQTLNCDFDNADTLRLFWHQVIEVLCDLVPEAKQVLIVNVGK